MSSNIQIKYKQHKKSIQTQIIKKKSKLGVEEILCAIDVNVAVTPEMTIKN
jgi:hypothetical protein